MSGWSRCAGLPTTSSVPHWWRRLPTPRRASTPPRTRGARGRGRGAAPSARAPTSDPPAGGGGAAGAGAGERGESGPWGGGATTRPGGGGRAEGVRGAPRHEAAEQLRLSASADAAEGVRAVSERRPGDYVGR